MKKNFILISVLLLLVSCEYRERTKIEKNKSVPVILVSKDSKGIFQKWLTESTGFENLKCIDMYPVYDKDSIRNLLSITDGIIISGGVDVNPILYGKENEIVRCGKLDKYRDILDQILIYYAVEYKIPLLGVCRGHQLLNITEGGTLIIDIPEDVGTDTLHRNKGRTGHMIYIKKDSYLYNIVKVDSGMIISNHHQAVDRLAPSFNISSYAIDKVVESIEPKDTLSHPFILGLQFHPERMDVKNPISRRIALKYLEKVTEHFERN